MGKVRKGKRKLTGKDIDNLSEECARDLISRGNYENKIEFETDFIVMMDDARAVLSWLMCKYDLYLNHDKKEKEP